MKKMIRSVAAVLVSLCLGACKSGGDGDAASVRQDPLCADIVLRVDPDTTPKTYAFAATQVPRIAVVPAQTAAASARTSVSLLACDGGEPAKRFEVVGAAPTLLPADFAASLTCFSLQAATTVAREGDERLRAAIATTGAAVRRGDGIVRGTITAPRPELLAATTVDVHVGSWTFSTTADSAGRFVLDHLPGATLDAVVAGAVTENGRFSAASYPALPLDSAPAVALNLSLDAPEPDEPNDAIADVEAATPVPGGTLQVSRSASSRDRDVFPIQVTAGRPITAQVHARSAIDLRAKLATSSGTVLAAAADTPGTWTDRPTIAWTPTATERLYLIIERNDDSAAAGTYEFRVDGAQ
jgi:hypothetical protein